MIIAKYKFDRSIYTNLIPIFDDWYTGYSINDIVDENNSNHIIRTIECDIVPSFIKFGFTNNTPTNTEAAAKSLIELLELNISGLTNLTHLFCNCNKLTSVNTSNWDTSNVTGMQSVFDNCRSLTSIDVSNWNTGNVDNMAFMFKGCHSLTSIDVSGWNVSNVNTMNAMFSYCESLVSLDVSKWDTKNVINMDSMFYYCKSLENLNVSNFDTSKVTTMGGMFNNCRSLTSLDVSKWNVSKVGEMYAMFSDCISLTDLDLANWDMSKVNTIGYMFDGKELGASINMPIVDLTSLDWSLVTDMQGTFYKNNAKAIKLPRIINPNLLSVISERNDGSFGLFYCPNLISLDFGGLDLSNLDSFSTANKHLVLEHVPKLRYIRTENAALIADLAQYFPARTEAEQGYLITKAEISDEIRSALSSKYWNIIDLEEQILIAKYKFSANVYKNNVPIFNSQFVNFFIEDEIENENEPNIITRSIFSINDIPTSIQFGVHWISESYELKHYPRTQSLRAVEYLNTSRIVSTNNMFRHCHNVTNIYASNWETCNFTNLNSTFENCSRLTSLDVSGWITDKVTDMEDMFRGCENLKTINGIENWNTDKVTTMMGMFQHCKVLSSINLSNFDTRNVNNMSNMFYQCHAITSLDVSGFDTSNVTNMLYMFQQCYNLTSLDVSNWNTSKVTNMGYMFSDCRSLTSLDVSNWDTSKVSQMSNMFYNCNKLTSIDVSKWDTCNVISMGGMFSDCHNLISVDVSNFNTNKVTDTWNMFCRCVKLDKIDVSKWNTSNIINPTSMFDSCESLTSIDVSKWVTSNMKFLKNMFEQCHRLKSVDVSNFDTRNVTDAQGMFSSCFELTSLDLSSFNTDRMVIMIQMIRSCKKLQMLDISNFNITDETDISGILNDYTTLSNIGMIYCNFKTVEKIASSVPATNPTTIWVGNHIDINGLPQYDHITYKVYEVEDKLEVELSSPLLEGDRLEIIDGDLYHYHKMGLEILNGVVAPKDYYLATMQPTDSSFINVYHNITGMKLFAIVSSDKFKFAGHNSINEECLLTSGVASNVHVILNKSRLVYDNVEGVKAWLKANPITLVYELANPYYELVKPNVGLLNAEQGLYLNISDSVVPVVNHQDLCTLKLNYLLPNVEYKVKFKANSSGSIAINLGGTLVPLDVVEGWNEVMVTTPETLVDEYLKVNGSEGIKIQNVMVIDSNKDFDYFKGMNNTFDEIPVKNICTNRTLTYTHGVDEEGVSPQGEMAVNVNKGKVVTVVGKVSNNPDNLPISINLYNDTGRATGKNLFDGKFIEDKIINTTDGAALQLNHVRGGYCTDFIEIDNTKHLTITGFCCDGIVYSCIFMYDKDKKYIGRTSGNAVGEGLRRILPTDGIDSVPGVDHTNITRNKFPNNCKYIRFSNYFTSSMNDQSTQYLLDNSTQLQIESHNGKTEYEPFRNYCNDEPIFINPDENGNFAIQIKADRDYANRIGFNVGDAFACEANDQVTITDLMVFEGDIIDCHPTTYVDPADTRYLVEYKSFGNPFGFGKNKLI